MPALLALTRCPCPAHLRRLPLQLPSGPVPLLVRLPGSTDFEVIDTMGPLVGHIKDAIVAKFKLETTPQKLQLFKLDDKGCRSGEALKSRQTLAEAGLLSATGAPMELEVVHTEVTTANAGA